MQMTLMFRVFYNETPDSNPVAADPHLTQLPTTKPLTVFSIIIIIILLQHEQHKIIIFYGLHNLIVII